MNPLKSLTKWAFLAISFLLAGSLASCSSSLDPFQNTCKGVDCSGHGECKIQGGKVVCVCDSGYYADGLECIEGTDPCKGISCSGHGECVVQSGNAVCVCDSGYHAEGLACVEDADSCEGIDCDDDNVCTDDSCDPAAGCVHQNNTAACDDNSACTENDICVDGVCRGQPRTCDDENPCSEDSCDYAMGCVFVPNYDGVVCDDGNVCTGEGVCSDGNCLALPLDFGTPCDDGVFCNGSDTCDGAGACVHTGDPCLDLRCDEGNLACREWVWAGPGGSGSDEELADCSSSGIFPLSESGHPIVECGGCLNGDQYACWGEIWRHDGETWSGPTGSGVISSLVVVDELRWAVFHEVGCGGRCSCMTAGWFEGGSYSDLGGCELWGHLEGSLAVDSEGRPILAIASDGIQVLMHDGAEWTEVGNLPLAPGEDLESLSLVLGGQDEMFLSYGVPPDYEIRIRRYDTESGTWVGVGESFVARGQCHTLGLDAGGVPYLAWVDGNASELYVKRFDGIEWVEVGEGSASGGGVSDSGGVVQCLWGAKARFLAFDLASEPMVTWVEGSIEGISHVYVKRFAPEVSGGSWLEMGIGSASGEGLSGLVAHDGEIHTARIASRAGRTCVAFSGLSEGYGRSTFVLCAN